MGGGAQDLLSGGTGNDTLTGGANKDMFMFEDGDGQDIITDFQVGIDVIDFTLQTSVNSFTEFTALAIQNGPDVELGLANGDSIVLSNVNLAALNATNFIF